MPRKWGKRSGRKYGKYGSKRRRYSRSTGSRRKSGSSYRTFGGRSRKFTSKVRGVINNLSETKSMRFHSYLVAVSSKPQLIRLSNWPQKDNDSGDFYIDAYREGIKMFFQRLYLRYQIIKGFEGSQALDTWVELMLVYKPFGVFSPTNDTVISDLWESTNPGHPEDPYPFDSWRPGTRKAHKVLFYKRVILNNYTNIQKWGWHNIRLNKLVEWNGPEKDDHEHGEMILFVRSFALSAAESTQKPIVAIRWDLMAKDIGGDRGEYFVATDA